MMGGVAGGMGAVVAGITSDALTPTTSPQQPTVQPPTTANTGTAAAPNAEMNEFERFKLEVDKLMYAKEWGLISEEEFEQMKRLLLLDKPTRYGKHELKTALCNKHIIKTCLTVA